MKCIKPLTGYKRRRYQAALGVIFMSLCVISAAADFSFADDLSFPHVLSGNPDETMTGSPSKAFGDDNREIYLRYISGQTTFFTEQEYPLQWERGKDFWPEVDALILRLTYVNQPVQERRLPIESPITFDLKYPALRAGVVAPVQLTIVAVKEDKVQPGVYQQTLYFYAKEDAVTWENAYKELHLGLVDQADNQSLTRFLDESKIPYTKLYSFADYSGQWLIVSGADLNDDLFTRLYQTMEKGVSILIVPPLKGSFPLPAPQKGTRLVFSDEKIIQDIDGRLDLTTIFHDGNSPTAVFKEKSSGEEVRVEVVSQESGYSWMEFKNEKARMIFLGWDLAVLYKDNPSGKEFFRQLILGEDIQ